MAPAMGPSSQKKQSGSVAGGSIPTGYRAVARFLLASGGPRVLLIALVLVALLRACTGAGWEFVDLLLMAALISTRGIFEWLVHAYVLHARPLPLLGICLHSPLSRAHDLHHRSPDRVDGVLFKGRSNMLLVGGMLVVFPLLFGERGLALVFTGTLLLVVYEVFHVLAHSGTRPDPGYLAGIVAQHRRHHADNPDAFFGVSSRLGDRLFGTDSDTDDGNPAASGG